MPKTLLVDAILFDMDGTLIDSTPGVLKAWRKFADDYSFDPTQVARAAHGRRLCDTLREHCTIGDDEVRLKAEVARFEAEVVEGGLLVLPGSIPLLTWLSGHTQTATRWTIVTSATDVFTSKSLQRCAIPIPAAGYVTSSDVARGKPHPDPYIAGANICGADPSNCLVIEDAPSGLAAGRAAGARTLAVSTSHTRQEIIDADVHHDFIVSDLTKVSVRWLDGKVEVTVDESDV